jgi:patatin-like phospholipase/acyl hydrolase
VNFLHAFRSDLPDKINHLNKLIMTLEKQKVTRILSIDGGGIRGIIPGQILVILEDKIKARTGNDNARIADYFDLIAGTSTGGILTCAYLTPATDNQSKEVRPKFDARQVVDLYLKNGGDIFSVPLGHKLRTGGGILDEMYPASHLEKALDNYFGNTKLSELIKPCLITSYDIKRRQGHFFAQHDALKRPGWDYLVKDVARSTSAAPTYFQCSDIKSVSDVSYPLIDGGVFVNNPTLCAFAEVYNEYKTAPEKMAILSLGTGYSKKEYDYEKAKDWGMIQWVKPLIDIMMSGVSEVVDYQLRQIFDAVGAHDHYIRINTELPIDVSSDMDDASPKNLKALKELGTYTAQNFDAQLDAFVELIV